MAMSRRSWMASLLGGVSTASLLAALGVRPRFGNGFRVAGVRKSIANGPVDAAAVLASPGIRCLVIGDWGSSSPLQHQVAAGMQSFARLSRPQFVISTGDNFYPNGVASADDPLFQEVFEDVYSGADLQVPWYSTLGNHDHFGDVDSQIAYSARSSRWRLPGRYYRFAESADGITADFFVLDTEDLIRNSAQTQLTWLDHELQSSKADWKICVGHHPIRSCGHYGSHPALVADLKPLLDRHGVAAYFCGHDHDLQFVKSPEDRFVCVVSGAGGKARDVRYGDDTLFARTNGGFAAVNLSRTEMAVGILDPDGQVAFVEHCLCMNPG